MTEPQTDLLGRAINYGNYKTKTEDNEVNRVSLPGAWMIRNYEEHSQGGGKKGLAPIRGQVG